MRTQKLKTYFLRTAVAAAVSLAAIPAVLPSSYAAVTMDEMFSEVPMYNPKTNEFFLVQTQDIADECMLTEGWLQVTPESLDTHVADVVKTAADVKAGNHLADVPILVGKNKITPQTAASRAYDLYVNAGLDSNSALQHVQGILAKITAKPGNYKELVESDLKSMKKSGTVKKAQTKTAEQAVQDLYAQLIQQGMTSDQAMAQVNAQLPSIVAQYQK